MTYFTTCWLKARNSNWHIHMHVIMEDRGKYGQKVTICDD